LVKAKRSSPINTAKSERPSTRKSKVNRNNYFEVVSTDSEDLVGNPIDERKSQSRSPQRRGMSNLNCSLSHLEQKAGEIMAHILADELQRSRIGTVTKISSKNGNLKEACIRAVLRLFYGQNAIIEESDETDAAASPFHMLGNRDYLSQLVADMYSNMNSLEDAEDLKLEIKQLEVSINMLLRMCASKISGVFVIICSLSLQSWKRSLKA
jgi:hypothetical protein